DNKWIAVWVFRVLMSDMQNTAILNIRSITNVNVVHIASCRY
ncbi:hypothetical protein D046_7498B, partial [Vibrio parahaemolyticus V-223/04]